MPTADEITRHHEEGEVVHVGSFATGYVVRIEEPDPAWAKRYEVLESGIREALGDRVLAVQHIGSTSVPGLPAKPIIDIDLAVADPTDEAAYVPDLEALGYVHWLTEPRWHQHRLLKMLTEPRVHLHVGPATGDDPGDLGAGMRYNPIKEPVVREIYGRMFEAAGLVSPGSTADNT